MQKQVTGKIYILHTCKHWKILETTLAAESNYLLAKLGSSLNSYSIFFAYQYHVDILFRILANTILKF